MKNSASIVLKITGRAFDDEPDMLARYISVFKKLLEKYKMVVVTGGGRIARKYIDLLRQAGLESNYWLDTIGIWVSRLNAFLLVAALSPYTYPRPATSIEEAVTALGSFKAVIMGGLIPGQSTASVLLQVAEALGVRRVYYYSAVGKVYTKDPSRYPDAEPLSTITASELKKMLEQSLLPGEYALIDTKALDLAIRSNITIQVLFYREPEQLLRALEGENPGTVIIPR
ncbi:MAG: UMP kinase [Desulfurococcaceae archaeon]